MFSSGRRILTSFLGGNYKTTGLEEEEENAERQQHLADPLSTSHGSNNSSSRSESTSGDMPFGSPSERTSLGLLQQLSGTNTSTSTDSIRKRKRNFTPQLLSPTLEDDTHPKKKRNTNQQQQFHNNNNHPLSNAITSLQSTYHQPQSEFLTLLPDDLLHYTLTFIHETPSRHALQCTCRKFQTLTNTDEMLKGLDLFGDCETGVGSLLMDIEEAEEGIEVLLTFAKAGNVQALYMIGMIVTYCFRNKVGLTILQHNAHKLQHLRSMYALGIILRDISKPTSDAYLQKAINANYLPACQENLSSQEVKERFGDLDAKKLRVYFDSVGLNRLLSKSYLGSRRVRKVASSHCWNPLCGRWAFKQSHHQQHHVAVGANGVGANNLGNNLNATVAAARLGNRLLPPLDTKLEASLCDLLIVKKKDASTSTSASSFSSSSSSSASVQNKNKKVQNGVDRNDNADDDCNIDTTAAVVSSSEGSDNADLIQSINDLSNAEMLMVMATTSRSTATSTTAATATVIPATATAASERIPFRVSRMKMCSSCRRAKYCSKLCQVYDWRSGRHKNECNYIQQH